MGIGRTWTSEEIEYLQENLGNVSMNYIALKLNRTPNAIVNKATRIGIGGATIKTDYLLPNIAAKMIGVDFKNIVYWIQCKNLKITRKAIRGKKKRILIEYDTFINFLKDNPNLWDSRKVEPYALGFEPKWLLEKREIDRKRPKNSQKKWSRFDEIEAERMKKEGEPLQKIADKLNRSYASVKRKLSDIRMSERNKEENDGSKNDNGRI